MMNDEDRENIVLIQRMASRDTKALDAFYDRYNRLVFSLVLKIIRTREDAEDIVVDVFWQVWQQSFRYDASRGKPLAWLLTIARTRAIDGLRSIRQLRHMRRGGAAPPGDATCLFGQVSFGLG